MEGVTAHGPCSHSTAVETSACKEACLRATEMVWSELRAGAIAAGVDSATDCPNGSPLPTVLILTDSRALMDSLEQIVCLSALNILASIARVTVRHVRAHADIAGNEYVDLLAKGGLSLANPPAPYAISCKAVKGVIEEWHSRHRLGWLRERATVSRRTEQCLLAADGQGRNHVLKGDRDRQKARITCQCEAGYCPLLFEGNLRGEFAPGKCRWCDHVCEGEDVTRTAHVLLRCPAFERERATWASQLKCRPENLTRENAFSSIDALGAFLSRTVLRPSAAGARPGSEDSDHGEPSEERAAEARDGPQTPPQEDSHSDAPPEPCHSDDAATYRSAKSAESSHFDSADSEGSWQTAHSGATSHRHSPHTARPESSERGHRRPPERGRNRRRADKKKRRTSPTPPQHKHRSYSEYCGEFKRGRWVAGGEPRQRRRKQRRKGDHSEDRGRNDNTNGGDENCKGNAAGANHGNGGPARDTQPAPAESPHAAAIAEVNSVLEQLRAAPPAERKRVFKQLALRWHPGKGGTKEVCQCILERRSAFLKGELRRSASV